VHIINSLLLLFMFSGMTRNKMNWSVIR